MTRTLVDSCVLLDVFTKDPAWFEWSSNAIANLADQGEQGVLVINPVIYSEISIRFTKAEDLDALLENSCFEYCPISQSAAFLAGKAFLQYRRSGGVRSSPLPDFFIGAHASVEQLALITRDTARFRTHFPEVTLICPDAAQR